MKHLITGALAALTLLGGTTALGGAVQAQTHYDRQAYSQADRGGHRSASQGWNGQSQADRGYGRGGDRYGRQGWTRGQYVPSSYRSRGQFVDYRREHLRHPPRGYGWVRGDSNQYLMIALTTGLIAAIASH